MVNATDITLDNLSRIIINPTFRWLSYLITLILVIYSFIIEPIRFSGKRGIFGISYKYEYFIMMCFTLFFYLFVFLGLWLTIPFTDMFSDYWYVPIMVIIFAFTLHITISSPSINLDGKKEASTKETFSPPPTYFESKYVRKIMYYAILVLDVLMFIQGLIYAGITTQFKTTVLHQFFLNRFGGTKPENMLNFATEWLGLIGILIDVYWIYGLETFTPCKYGLPASWDL